MSLSLKKYSGTANIKDDIVQIFLTLVVCLLSVFVTIQVYWQNGDHSFIIDTIIGVTGGIVTLFCVFYKRLFLKFDFITLAAFFFAAMISSFVAYGFSFGYFFSPFFCMGMALLALYYVVQAVSDCQLFMKSITMVLVLALSIICLFVLINASYDLSRQVPLKDPMRGFVTGSRLCGLGNENIMAFHSTALLLLSMFGVINSVKWQRIIYLATCFLGWFTLGMAGSRTCQIGVSISVALLVIPIIWVHRNLPIIKNNIIAIVVKVVIPMALFVLVFFSFRIVMPLYKVIVSGVALLSGNKTMLNNQAELSLRPIEDDGSFNGRIPIWIQVIKNSFDDVRHAVFGISCLNTEWVKLPLERGEASYAHAHNMILELLRKDGLLGTVIWSFPFIYWCKAGIKTLFDNNERYSYRFLAAAAAGMLLMGIAEPVPIHYGYALSVPFFLICGLCVRLNRDREAQKSGETYSGTQSETPEKSVE